jgi:hypothetical protein
MSYDFQINEDYKEIKCEVRTEPLHIISMNYASKGCPVFVITVAAIRTVMCSNSGWLKASPAVVALAGLPHIFIDLEELQMCSSCLLFLNCRCAAHVSCLCIELS